MFGYYMDMAWRRCRQGPAMVLLLVLTMAIGIASCMTAMTIFGALSGEPLPGVSDHLYVVTMDARESDRKGHESYDEPQSLLNLRDAKALVDAHRARSQIAVTRSLMQVSTPDGKVSDRVVGLMGYGPVPTTLGVPLRFGRPWTLVEEAAHEPVVVIDTTLATKLFGTEDAVGRNVRMGSRLFRVIGIAAPWRSRTQILDLNQGLRDVLGTPMQFYVPVDAALASGIGPLSTGKCGDSAPVISFQSVDVGHCRWIETWVGLENPVRVAAYSSFVAGYAQQQHDAGRFVNPPRARLYGTREWMDVNHVVPSDVDLNLMLAGTFLLLCMINVAGLLAARFLRRRGDIAIRRALGAARRHIFAQHLIEAGMLGLAGGMLALPLTLLGLWIVRMQPVGYAAAARFSLDVFFGLLALSLAVGLVVGILPAWRVCRQPPALQIKLV